MANIKNKALEKAAEEIERARNSGESKQPRFIVSAADAQKFFSSIYGMVKGAIFDEPAYMPDSVKRDTWLAKVVKKEPYLLGVLQSVVSIDKNRGWTIVGGKIQVRKYVDILHSFQAAPDLYGWRNGMSMSAQNYYQSDLGAVVEIGRSQTNGPLAMLYTVDPTKCRLTGNLEYPLRYNNGARDKQEWSPWDYFRVTSFPSTYENYSGLGYCAVSRCIEIAKIVVSVFEHYREQLGSKAPKGILTVKGVSLDQWLASLEESTDQLATLEREYYSGVQVLASENDINVNLTSLSNLPQQFEYEKFISLAMYGYALAFGYDPREFWPVSGGTLGTGKETESQHRKATSKGGLDFALAFQEKLQEELPPTLDFEFEQRDAEGDILEAQLKQAQLNIIDQMSKSTASQGEPLISRDEARQLLVEAGLIKEEWTLYEEEVQISDTDDKGETNLLEKQRVQEAIKRFPNEDIVSYSEKTGKYRVLRKAGEKKFSMQVRHPEIKRAFGDSYEKIRSEYYDAISTAVSGYLNSKEPTTVYANAMRRSVSDAFGFSAERGYVDGGGELPLDGDISDWLSSAQSSEMDYVGALFTSLKYLRDSGEFNAEAEAETRAEGYASTLDGIYNKAILFGAGNKMLTFVGDDGAESCATCQMLKGQRHRASWWIAHDYVPPVGDGLDCSGGGRCEHYLEDDNGEWWTE